ncbi:hypothetical protein NMYAN_20039 [Nitrosomonas nitrosa]|uniref:EAL domain-containing protein n=2 Tax=Nitrosomonas nitrosa TaxID=52442 RepID=A0A8H9DB33_9PROT|nr:hypothetical protein NMYAN_20039 [Nitrosomonas nitrosa]
MQHMRILREQGCFLHQGYYFSRPAPIVEFWSLIEGSDRKLFLYVVQRLNRILSKKRIEGASNNSES